MYALCKHAHINPFSTLHFSQTFSSWSVKTFIHLVDTAGKGTGILFSRCQREKKKRSIQK